MSMDLTDNHRYLSPVILVSWANFGLKEYTLGEIPGGDYSEIARVHASCKSLTVRSYNSIIEI